MITVEFIVIILCLLVGTRFGGMGLGLISGIGLFILTFVFGLEPGKPPVEVMLTILAVIGCAATLQTAGGLNVMMQFAEKLLRRHPQHITLLAPFTTWTLTFLCGTGHVVYTMFPIIADIALKKGIRPERPMAVASIASQMAITASPVSVAVVSLVSIIAANHGVGQAFGILEILAVSVPASLFGVLIAALWSLRRGKNLEDDREFQEKIKDPKQREFIFGSTETLMNQVFPKQAWWSTWIFFAGILVVVLLGAIQDLRPAFEVKGVMKPLSMNLVIQMMMLIAGAIMLIVCKVNPAAISNGAVFKAGMVAIFSVGDGRHFLRVRRGMDERHLFPGASGRAENGAGGRGENPSVDLRAGAVFSLQTGKQPGGGVDCSGAHGPDARRRTQNADCVFPGLLRLFYSADLPQRSGLHRF